MSLRQEADVFARALIGRPAGAYAATQYGRAHEHLPLAPSTAFDRTLVSAAAMTPLLARAADAYARFFARGSLLRRKLTVLTAILESSAGTDAAYAPLAAPVPLALLRLAGTGLAFTLSLLAGIILFAPVHVVTAIMGRRP